MVVASPQPWSLRLSAKTPREADYGLRSLFSQRVFRVRCTASPKNDPGALVEHAVGACMPVTIVGAAAPPCPLRTGKVLDLAAHSILSRPPPQPLPPSPSLPPTALRLYLRTPGPWQKEDRLCVETLLVGTLYRAGHFGYDLPSLRDIPDPEEQGREFAVPPPKMCLYPRTFVLPSFVLAGDVSAGPVLGVAWLRNVLSDLLTSVRAPSHPPRP